MVNIRIIRVLSLLIMAAAAAVSYGTQRTLFLGWQVDSFTAAVAPISVDLLAIICTLAIHTDGVARKGKRTAIFVLVVTGTGSVAANWVAGETLGSKIVHGAMVVLYLMAEWVAAQVRQAPAAVVAVGQDLTGAVQTAISEIVADEAASPDLPEAPTSPGPQYSERHERRLRRGR